ncbi:DUF2252 domain-containing protein [Gordonia sp. (in: high G+C Gram-positive bacteria)]|uniref:DUF2252 domain-containing protein n=1 Tax=Gordonia sp. (in: high G+C Gram-positive bacteria) TaxID=84139 RepID=UPI0016A02054|nr:DUF2252 domain-containing protein [Gordonia sp. (in: high G+C Gram-positive bacteria)]NLG48280.1 DUF2252 domain-containing protein [Gordonia sp. (in: high G+C Gram-positive bacteria)]
MTLAATDLGEGPVLTGRRDPVAILRTQDATRLRDLVPVRHARMAATPFTFYRGAAAVMAADLASTPNSGITTQLCGDAHLSNFGLFLSPERRMVFDLNDFDETHPGPFEWDVKRLAASMAVAAQGNGGTDKEAHRAARRAARAYRRAMSSAAERGALQCWYDNVDPDRVKREIGDRLDTAANKNLKKTLAKAYHRNSEQALSKLCVVDETGVRIKSDPPLLIPAADVLTQISPNQLREQFLGRIAAYRETLPLHLHDLIDQYEFVEAARKVVGVGSVGTRCWIALFAGRLNRDPLFLQLKEAQQSVLAPYVDAPEFSNQGERVVVGQRLLQASSDVLLGWFRSLGFASRPDGTAESVSGLCDFYVRQLRDGKGSAVIEDMPVDRLTLYGELCGAVLGQAHARTSARGEIADYVGGLGKKFDGAVADWALGYTQVNRADHARLVDAITTGEIDSARLDDTGLRTVQERKGPLVVGP